MGARKDFSKLDAVIAAGEADVASRPLADPRPQNVRLVPATGNGDAQSPSALTPTAAVEEPPPPPGAAASALAAESTTALRKRKLTLELTEETVLALYARQAVLRSDPGMKPAETTVGWVADGLLREGLGLAVTTRATAVGKGQD
jgi:hypothetical protein